MKSSTKTPITRLGNYANEPYRAVLVIGPDHPEGYVSEVIDAYKKTELPCCIFGDGKTTVNPADITEELQGKVAVNPHKTLWVHGLAKNGQHSARLDANLLGADTPTEDILYAMKEGGGHYNVKACFAGALKNPSVLQNSPDSFLTTYSAPDSPSYVYMNKDSIISGIQHYKDGVGPVEAFAASMAESPETKTITSARPGIDGKPLHHTARPSRVPVLIGEQGMQMSSKRWALNDYATALDGFNGDREGNTQLVNRIMQIPPSPEYACDALKVQIRDGNAEYFKGYLAGAKARDNTFTPDSLQRDHGVMGCLDHKPAPIIRAFMEADGNIDQIGLGGFSAMHWAAVKDKTSVIEALVAVKADPNLFSIDGSTALHTSAKNGHLSATQALVKAKANLDTLDTEGLTPLDHAFYHGHGSVADVLLSAGAKINQRNIERLDKDGNTPLQGAVEQGNPISARRLIDAKANVNIPYDNGSSMLHRSSLYGHAQMTAILLEGGASANQRDNQGSTALHKAVSMEHVSVAEVLTKAGADVNLTNKYSETPLHYAARRNNSAMSDVLIKAGADIHKPTKRGATPLQLAVSNHNVGATDSLLKAGAYQDASIVKKITTQVVATGDVLKSIKAESARQKITAPLYNAARRAIKTDPELGEFYEGHKPRIKTTLHLLRNEQPDQPTPDQQKAFIGNAVDAMKACKRTNVSPSFNAAIQHVPALKKSDPMPLVTAPDAQRDLPRSDVELARGRAEKDSPRAPQQVDNGLTLPPAARLAQASVAAQATTTAPAMSMKASALSIGETLQGAGMKAGKEKDPTISTPRATPAISRTTGVQPTL